MDVRVYLYEYLTVQSKTYSKDREYFGFIPWPDTKRSKYQEDDRSAENRLLRLKSEEIEKYQKEDI